MERRKVTILIKARIRCASQPILTLYKLKPDTLTPIPFHE